MSGVSRLEFIVLGLMFSLQLVLLVTANPLTASFAPPMLAALPMAYAATRSEQAVGAMKRRLRRAFLSIFVLSAVTAAFFVLPAEDDLSFRLQILRMLLVDMTVLWLATALWVACDIDRDRPLRS